MTEDAVSAAPEYVAARKVLIDALEALAVHRGALVIVGAQAVYLRTLSVDLAVAPFTTDGDLAVHPHLLNDNPRLEDSMQDAGFKLQITSQGATEPGIWTRSVQSGDRIIDVEVDLIVPEGVAAPGGRRAARLPGHGRNAARKTRGLEARFG